MKHIFACAVFALLCLLCVGCRGAVQGVSQVPTPTPTLRADSTRATPAAPVTTPTTSPTAPPAALPAPTLGAAFSLWQAHYSSLTVRSLGGQTLYQTQDNSDAPVLTLTFGVDPLARAVDTVLVEEPSVWSIQNTHATQAPLRFLPADALKISAQTTTQGLLVTYQSATLARVFAPDRFLDNAGRRVAPGTCSLFYTYAANSTTLFDHAQLTLGTTYLQ